MSSPRGCHNSPSPWRSSHGFNHMSHTILQENSAEMFPAWCLKFSLWGPSFKAEMWPEEVDEVVVLLGCKCLLISARSGQVPPHAGFSVQETTQHAKTWSLLGLIICFKRKHPSLEFVVNKELVGAKCIFPRVVSVMEELQEFFLQLPWICHWKLPELCPQTSLNLITDGA